MKKMDRKRSIGVTVFGILLDVAAVYVFVAYVWKFIDNGINYGWEDALFEMVVSSGSPVTIIGLIVISIGIFKLKKWARIVCLCLAYFFGAGIIFLGSTFGIAFSSEPDRVVYFRLILLVVCTCVPVIYFLSNPNVKKQFS